MLVCLHTQQSLLWNLNSIGSWEFSIGSWEYCYSSWDVFNGFPCLQKPWNKEATNHSNQWNTSTMKFVDELHILDIGFPCQITNFGTQLICSDQIAQRLVVEESLDISCTDIFFRCHVAQLEARMRELNEIMSFQVLAACLTEIRGKGPGAHALAATSVSSNHWLPPNPISNLKIMGRLEIQAGFVRDTLSLTCSYVNGDPGSMAASIAWMRRAICSSVSPFCNWLPVFKDCCTRDGREGCCSITSAAITCQFKPSVAALWNSLPPHLLECLWIGQPVLDWRRWLLSNHDGTPRHKLGEPRANSIQIWAHQPKVHAHKRGSPLLRPCFLDARERILEKSWLCKQDSPLEGGPWSCFTFCTFCTWAPFSAFSMSCFTLAWISVDKTMVCLCIDLRAINCPAIWRVQDPANTCTHGLDQCMQGWCLW